MSLTKTQLAIIEKARSLGGGGQAVALSDEDCGYLLAVIVADLRLGERFPEIPRDIPPVFGRAPLAELRVEGLDFLALFERLINLAPDADTYFSCLARLHKSRLKYTRIMETQPVPTVDQVGPRSLLQYGVLSPSALLALLLWRKWIFDIDNRAGQETGYLFEPIIAHAIGGVPASAKKSPVRRRSDRGKGRQVDCIRQRKAYEFKLRVTIAASGQGRWQEELEFPEDCKASGYVPVLIVLDPTPNPKLEELVKAFRAMSGETYVGKEAWAHLETAAGPTMGLFLEKYVHQPLEALLNEAPETLPEIALRMDETTFSVSVGEETLVYGRAPDAGYDEPDGDQMPEDADEDLPGE